MGIPKWDGALETILRILATVVLLISIAFGGWLLWRMFRSTKDPANRTLQRVSE